ncbi:putative oxidoreductase [Acaryochloris thomasi RCC1774]|uniref:Putative oxidoreductase n=1 Tax=Acaryochloris thomasi RCC1774 TaxID=1764569 RepID=A0A2W1JIF6_9CYAN|nr:SDR family oxidoreductase [Acaryochloris thomasi]PZD73280.1 putative oxidoreductase [Acaryochloris thomasi RCC1774]
MSKINQTVTIVTGASSGIGEAIARELANAGGKVMLAARREDRLKELATELGDGVAYHATDVTDVDQTRALVQATIAKFGQVDVFINNAGVMPVSPLIDLKLDDWNTAIDVNIRGVLHGIAAVLPHLMERGSGHVINIGSVASLHVFPNFGVYCGTKFAVKAISEALRKETLGKVRVTTIYPGAVESELITASNDQQTGEQVEESFSFISPTAISRAVLYAIEQPDDVSVNEIVVRPSDQEL